MAEGRAFLVRTPTVIEPFGDPVATTLIIDRPLAEVQQDALREAGFGRVETVVGPPPVESGDTTTTGPDAARPATVAEGRTAGPDGAASAAGETMAAPGSADGPVALRETGASRRHPGGNGAQSPIVGDGFALVMHDTLFITARLIREFVERARVCRERVSRLWLKKGLFTRLLAVVQDGPEDAAAVAMPLWLVPPGRRFVADDAAPVVIDVDEDSYEGHFPPHMIKKEGYRFCLTARPAINITEPLHLALANLAANFARLAEMKKMGAWGKLKLLCRARSLNKFRLLAAASAIHPEAEVHPTAVVEGSVVERGAKIGAYAVVRFSHVGERAFIDDHAGLKFSIVGNGAYVANNCVLFFSVVYPRAFLISGPFQFTLFGYDTALMNAIPADYRLDGEPITIRTRRGVVSTGLRFCGSVIGHRTKIAAGVIIAPGRMIPNDLMILPDPGRVINRIEADLPTDQPLFLVSGRLVTAEQLANVRGGPTR